VEGNIGFTEPTQQNVQVAGGSRDAGLLVLILAARECQDWVAITMPNTHHSVVPEKEGK
tara:strand:+ start:218 stop:394 length:177 start_codon:yes stop_codon:yes gene_type:complete